ncbi:MAG: hypothetical protein M1817_001741 [Caeruleum heppii]|nr:MAG: hypothetical protein M1817_001741 [Caeruleum heppii]
MHQSGFHPFKGKVSRHFGDSVPNFEDSPFVLYFQPQPLSPDDAYLSYYDVRLTKEDVDTLRNDWLTDNVIAFWEEYLEREELSQYPSSNIVLLRPSMSFMLMQTPDPMTLKEALPDFKNTTHIFLPINDCHNVEIAEGGSHWSLLLVSVIDRVAFHYDSLTPSNEEEATLATNKISQLLRKPLRLLNLKNTPQQQNSSDCGVYVCIQMQHLLLKRLLTANLSAKISMSMESKNINSSAGRKEMLKVIEYYRKEGERRRSRSSSPFSKKDQSKSPPRVD